MPKYMPFAILLIHTYNRHIYVLFIVYLKLTDNHLLVTIALQMLNLIYAILLLLLLFIKLQFVIPASF